MEKLMENTLQNFLLDDFKTHIQIVLNALSQSPDISVLLKRQGDQVFVYYQKAYDNEVNDILDESKREYQRRKSLGYNREQAFQDFMEVQQELNKLLQ